MKEQEERTYLQRLKKVKQQATTNNYSANCYSSDHDDTRNNSHSRNNDDSRDNNSRDNDDSRDDNSRDNGGSRGNNRDNDSRGNNHPVNETAPQQPSPDQFGKQIQEQAIQAITQLGTPQIAVTNSNIVCITIIGQIEGHMILPPQNKTTKYEHIIPQLVAAEQNNNIEGVLIILNTVGGDVEAGLAIAELISTMTKPSVTLVLGGGHSIGAPIAVSGNVSYIAATATMTIHPIRTTGLVIGVPQSFEYLEKMQERVTRFIMHHSNIDEGTFKALMYKTGELTRDIGTTIIGEEAVKHGLIDRVGGIGDALATLKEMIEEKKEHERTS